MARRTPPASKAKAAPAKANGKHHVTTVRLDDDEYRRLRKYIALHEARTGERLTHQNLFKDALFEHLTKHGGD
jgi:hypothetical protein